MAWLTGPEDTTQLTGAQLNAGFLFHMVSQLLLTPGLKAIAQVLGFLAHHLK
jgi:hypothetical protein